MDCGWITGTAGWARLSWREQTTDQLQKQAGWYTSR